MANTVASQKSKVIREESLTKVHPLRKNLLTGKIPNLQLAGRLALSAKFGKNWPTPRSGNFICGKVVRESILESFSAKDYSKTGDSIQNTGIAIGSGDYGLAGQRIHKNVEYHFSGQFLSNILLVKNKDRGNRPYTKKRDGENRPYINLKALNKLIPYKHFKIEGLLCLKYPLEENDFLCK